MTESKETTALIKENAPLQSYYHKLESRIGYRLVLGGTRHFGYWYVFSFDRFIVISSYMTILLVHTRLGTSVVI